MGSRILGCLVVVLALGSVCEHARAQQVVPEERDRVIEIEVMLAMLADPELCCYYPCARVEKNVIRLGGYMPSQGLRDKALQLAKRVSGLYVQNELQVQPSLAVRPVDAPGEVLLKHATMAMKAEFSQDCWSWQLALHTQGQLVLQGWVLSREKQLLISERLRRIPGCVSIRNDLKISSDPNARRRQLAAPKPHPFPPQAGTTQPAMHARSVPSLHTPPQEPAPLPKSKPQSKQVPLPVPSIPPAPTDDEPKLDLPRMKSPGTPKIDKALTPVGKLEIVKTPPVLTPPPLEPPPLELPPPQPVAPRPVQQQPKTVAVPRPVFEQPKTGVPSRPVHQQTPSQPRVAQRFRPVPLPPPDVTIPKIDQVPRPVATPNARQEWHSQPIIVPAAYVARSGPPQSPRPPQPRTPGQRSLTIVYKQPNSAPPVPSSNSGPIIMMGQQTVSGRPSPRQRTETVRPRHDPGLQQASYTTPAPAAPYTPLESRIDQMIRQACGGTLLRLRVRVVDRNQLHVWLVTRSDAEADHVVGRIMSIRQFDAFTIRPVVHVAK